MRYVGGVLGMGVLLLLTGCSNSRWGSVFRSQQQAAAPSAETPTAAALLDHLNRNSRQIQSLECMELDMECRQKMQAVGLMGRMVCQRPRNFRLGATVLGNPQVDLGSNEQEFWFWIGKSDPPYLFHCSYADFARREVRLPFPFQPDWIMEALGMAEYGAPQNYRLIVRDNTTLELVENARTPQGQAVQKVTIFNRNKSPDLVQVREYHLRDANQKDICSAYITEVQQPGGPTGPVVPRRIRLQWPSEGIELKLKLDEVVINRPLNGERAARLFTRPQLANIQSYDLANGPDPAPGQIRRTGGVAR